MPPDRNHLIKIYVHRLVSSLVPADYGSEYTQSLSEELYHHLVSTSPSQVPDLHTLANQIKRKCISQGRSSDWVAVNTLLERLSRVGSDSVAKYLTFLLALDHGPSLTSSPYRSPASVHSVPGSSTLAETVLPYSQSRPEADILTYLPYTLLGLDSVLVTFSHNGATLPDDLNAGYTGILLEILEGGLVYRWLKESVDTKKGRVDSPIKTAFLRALESEVARYVDTINIIFESPPPLVILVLPKVKPLIYELRQLHLLMGQFDDNGYHFLLRVHQLTKSGNLRTKQLAERLFSQMCVPYYEILENWIIKGELTDTNHEFFIRFNVTQTHINDIIEFVPDQIPSFFTAANKSIGTTIFHIGKLLIFLAKYCKELDWVNTYNTKYLRFVFHKHAGLKSMDMNLISHLVATQYAELINHFTVVMYRDNHLFHHLTNFKKFYFMGCNDFIDTVMHHGERLFSEPSSSLTSNQLGGILYDSISVCLPVRDEPFVNRLDARILDLAHGNEGWEVFTLEYKVSDLPVEIIFDYNNGLVEYLKMFNFLWRLRHLQHSLHNGFLEANSIWRTDLSAFHQRHRYIKSSSKRDPSYHMGVRDTKIAWLMRTFTTTNVIRKHFIDFVNEVVHYFSCDLIESSFQLLAHRLLDPSDNRVKIDPAFAARLHLDDDAAGLAKSTTLLNVNELTIDDLTQIHSTYVSAITSCRLLNELVTGKISGESYVRTLYSIVDLAFLFITASHEFLLLLVNHVALLNVNTDGVDDDLEALQEKLEVITSKMQSQIHVDFVSLRKLLAKDLRQDLDLKDLGRAL